VKTLESGWLCLTLVLCGWVKPGAAQPQPPTTPGQDQPAQGQPVQPGTSSSTLRPLPPPMPKVPDVRLPGETGIWASFTGWFPDSWVVMDKGHAAQFPGEYSRVALQGNPKIAEGVDIGIAVGLHNALRVSYFDARAAGDLTPNIDTQLWTQLYPNGTLLSTNYRVQAVKMSFEYLTWPYPVESRRFRLKTLYQVQYIGVRTAFDNPTLPLVDANGNPIVDANGNPISYGTEASKWYVTPTLGLGVAYWKTKRFRLEANASGFAIPHHTTTIDTDASANWRFGHWELKVGAKGFHFKTSPKGDFYMRGTMVNAMAGIRWYSN